MTKTDTILEVPEMQVSAIGDTLELRTEGLFKKYGKRTVVNDVSFNVKQGEIVGLLGPNGAGKTTSFYMTTGLVVPNAGRIYLGNEEITNYPVYKRAKAGIGYLIVYGGQVFKLDLVMSAVFILCVLAAGMYALVALAERLLIKNK